MDIEEKFKCPVCDTENEITIEAELDFGCSQDYEVDYICHSCSTEVKLTVEVWLEIDTSIHLKRADIIGKDGKKVFIDRYTKNLFEGISCGQD